MLLHLAKFASMFGLKSSAGSYVKMQNECSLDTENPFCPQVGVSASDNRVYLGCILGGVVFIQQHLGQLNRFADLFLSGSTENTV